MGLGLASALAGASVVETITVNLYFHQLFRICLHLKVGPLSLVWMPLTRVCVCACIWSLHAVAMLGCPPLADCMRVPPRTVPQIALVDMLYRKSLRISAAAKGELGAGKIVNLQSNDAGGRGGWGHTNVGLVDAVGRGRYA